MSDRTDTRTVDRYLPRIQCTAWCEHGDGHPHNLTPQDQACWSTERMLYLSTAAPVEESKQWAPDGQDTFMPGPDYVVTYLQRNGAGAPVTVVIGLREGPEIAMTPTETVQLLDALRRLLATAAEAAK